MHRYPATHPRGVPGYLPEYDRGVPAYLPEYDQTNQTCYLGASECTIQNIPLKYGCARRDSASGAYAVYTCCSSASVTWGSGV